MKEKIECDQPRSQYLCERCMNVYHTYRREEHESECSIRCRVCKQDWSENKRKITCICVKRCEECGTWYFGAF